MDAHPQKIPISDVLLLSLCRDPAAPHYSEEGFERKLRREGRRVESLPIPVEQLGDSYLARREWSAIIHLARLTAAQTQVLRLRTIGFTFAQIGQCRGHSKQASRNIFLQAIQKISAVQNVYPMAGLAEVYRSERNRQSSRSRLVY